MNVNAYGPYSFAFDVAIRVFGFVRKLCLLFYARVWSTFHFQLQVPAWNIICDGPSIHQVWANPRCLQGNANGEEASS